MSFVCPKFSVCRGWGLHAGTFVKLLLRCNTSFTPILPSLETFSKTRRRRRKTFENTPEQFENHGKFVKHGNLMQRRFQFF